MRMIDTLREPPRSEHAAYDPFPDASPVGMDGRGNRGRVNGGGLRRRHPGG